jgi:hypothetical protein
MWILPMDYAQNVWINCILAKNGIIELREKEIRWPPELRTPPHICNLPQTIFTDWCISDRGIGKFPDRCTPQQRSFLDIPCGYCHT